MTIGAQFATLAYVETMRRNLMLAISGAGVTALPPASESEEGIDTFLGLTDTPDDYTSMAGRLPVVNAAEGALEFNPYVLIDPASPILTVRNMSDGDVDIVHKWASGATPVVRFSDGLDLTDGNYLWCNTDGLVDTTAGGTGFGTYLIIADYTNNRIKQHLASTLAYSSQVASAGAHRVCTDGTNYYVSDATNHQIRKYLMATNTLLWTVGTQGSGDDQFNSPQGICTDGTYLYIADSTNNRIKKHLCTTGAYVAKFGSYGNVGGTFNAPTGICIDGTHLYVTQNSNETTRILKHLCADLSYVSCLADDGHIDSATNLDVCTDGAFLYLVNANNSAINSIFKYTLALFYVSEYGANGSGDTQFAGPCGICTDKTYLYITDTGNARIKQHLISDYSYVAQVGTSGTGDSNFNSPRGISIGFLSDIRAGRLLRLRQDGSHFEVWPKLDLYSHLVLREGSALATDYVALKAPSAIATSYTLTLPAADAAGALSSDGAGALSFTAVAPVGAKYIVQEVNATLTAEQSLGALATGILKNTTTAGVGVLSIAVGADLPAHELDSAVHSVSGLTPGHFLKATGAATFGFAAHGLTAADVSAEPALGNPDVDGKVLSSTALGVRSWIAAGGAVAVSDLTDVDLTGLADDNILRYDSASGNWLAEALPAAANHDILSVTHGDTTVSAPNDGDVLTYDTGKWVAAVPAGGGAPTDADYVVETANAGLSAESVLGTTVITTAALASRQAAAKAGRLFLPSNSFYAQRDTGAAWTSWGPIWQLTPPVAGDFAWVNQGTATSDSTYGGLSLFAPADANNNLKILKKSSPATPYTITACFLINAFKVDYSFCGLMFRQSSDGKIITFVFAPNDATPFRVDKWSNETTYSNIYSAVPGQNISSLLWLRIADNGTNRICSFSTDGYYWYQVHSVGRTDFLAADEIGIVVNSHNATYPARATLISWKEE